MKRRIAIVLILMLVAAASLWKLSRSRSYQVFGELVARVETEDKVVALTLDDGPGAAYTDTVLAVLRKHDVKATFFVTGREVEANLEQARRIVTDGHELGNHSYTHPQMMFMRPERIRHEVERTDTAIRKAGYEGKIYFRPPYAKKLFYLPWYLAQTDRTTIMWDIEPESFQEIGKDADLIAAHVLEEVQPGSIILLHVMYDSRAPSREVLPLLIDGLRKEGYRFVTVSELLQKEGN